MLFLKGEVEQIAMMKPKAQTEHDEGMLEFLEDIIGSSRFKNPIDQLTQRVEELNDLRVEKVPNLYFMFIDSCAILVRGEKIVDLFIYHAAVKYGEEFFEADWGRWLLNSAIIAIEEGRCKTNFSTLLKCSFIYMI